MTIERYFLFVPSQQSRFCVTNVKLTRIISLPQINAIGLHRASIDTADSAQPRDHSVVTRPLVGSAWAQDTDWVSWCQSRNLASFPGSPERWRKVLFVLVMQGESLGTRLMKLTLLAGL